MEEVVKSVRLTPQEQEYLSKYWNNNFSNFIHNSIQDQITLTKKNGLRNRMSYNATTMIMMLIAMMMFVQVMMTTNIYLQFFGVIIGLLSLSLGVLNILGEQDARGQ